MAIRITRAARLATGTRSRRMRVARLATTSYDARIEPITNVRNDELRSAARSPTSRSVAWEKKTRRSPGADRALAQKLSLPTDLSKETSTAMRSSRNTFLLSRLLVVLPPENLRYVVFYFTRIIRSRLRFSVT